MNSKKRKFVIYFILMLVGITVSFIAITNFYKYDIFGLTQRGKFYSYYGTKLEFPKAATDIKEYSDVSGFPADGTEVITFKVSKDELEKLLHSHPFGRTDQWQSGPYPDGCLGGFLTPCENTMSNKFAGNADHIAISNSDKVYYAVTEYSETEPRVVIILDFKSLQVLVYKYSS